MINMSEQIISAPKPQEKWAAFRLHMKAFAAARNRCDSRWPETESGRLVPESERTAFLHTYRTTLLLSATNFAGLSGLLCGAAITSMAKHVPWVEHNLIKRRTPLSAAAAATAAIYCVTYAPRLGMLDGVYGQLLGSDTALGDDMRRAYTDVYPDSPFIAVARNVAKTAAGRSDASMVERFNRFAAMLPFVPDPTGSNTANISSTGLLAQLPHDMQPSRLAYNMPAGFSLALPGVEKRNDEGRDARPSRQGLPSPILSSASRTGGPLSKLEVEVIDKRLDADGEGDDVFDSAHGEMSAEWDPYASTAYGPGRRATKGTKSRGTQDQSSQVPAESKFASNVTETLELAGSQSFDGEEILDELFPTGVARDSGLNISRSKSSANARGGKHSSSSNDGGPAGGSGPQTRDSRRFVDETGDDVPSWEARRRRREVMARRD